MRGHRERQGGWHVAGDRCGRHGRSLAWPRAMPGGVPCPAPPPAQAPPVQAPQQAPTPTPTHRLVTHGLGLTDDLVGGHPPVLVAHAVVACTGMAWRHVQVRRGMARGATPPRGTCSAPALALALARPHLSSCRFGGRQGTASRGRAAPRAGSRLRQAAGQAWVGAGATAAGPRRLQAPRQCAAAGRQQRPQAAAMGQAHRSGSTGSCRRSRRRRARHTRCRGCRGRRSIGT